MRVDYALTDYVVYPLDIGKASEQPFARQLQGEILVTAISIAFPKSFDQSKRMNTTDWIGTEMNRKKNFVYISTAYLIKLNLEKMYK